MIGFLSTFNHAHYLDVITRLSTRTQTYVRRWVGMSVIYSQLVWRKTAVLLLRGLLSVIPAWVFKQAPFLLSFDPIFPHFTFLFLRHQVHYEVCTRPIRHGGRGSRSPDRPWLQQPELQGWELLRAPLCQCKYPCSMSHTYLDGQGWLVYRFGADYVVSRRQRQRLLPKRMPPSP